MSKTLPQLTETTTVEDTDELLVNDGGNARRASLTNVFKGRTLLAAVGSAAAPTYTFEGDLNTGLWRPEADTVAVSTNGVERARLSNSVASFGSEGAGTTLVVHGSGTGSAEGGEIRLQTADDHDTTTAWWGIDANQDDMRVIEGGIGTRATFAAGGNVGIGTPFPSTSLHVNGPIRMGSYTVATVPAAGTVGAGTIIYVSDETGGPIPAFSNGADWRRMSDRAVIVAV